VTVATIYRFYRSLLARQFVDWRIRVTVAEWVRVDPVGEVAVPVTVMG
jgi:hypothetical protein